MRTEAARKTDLFSLEFSITAVLIGIHWGPLLLAAWLWPLRKLNVSISSAVTLVFTILAWIIVAVCLLLFFDVRANGRNMTGFAAYLIYSVMTFGVLPIGLVAIHVFAGRSAGLWIGSLLRRRRSRGAARKSTSAPGR